MDRLIAIFLTLVLLGCVIDSGHVKSGIGANRFETGNDSYSMPNASQTGNKTFGDVAPVANQTSGENNSIPATGLNDTRTRKFMSEHYQLQNATFSGLENLSADVLIVDPDDSKLTNEQIKKLQTDGKVVLAYLSIGEAEDYRSYWQPDWKIGSPSFIDEQNPQWLSYKVKFWDPRWQAIVLNRTRNIAELGYDGVYLDIVDAYSYYEDRGVTDADIRMIDFVRNIRNNGPGIRSDFLIVPQNAVELYKFEDYRKIIDGFGKEDTWYYDDNLQDPVNAESDLFYLDQAVKDGKFVLAIDYPTTQKNICDFYQKCWSHGFACTVSDRALDKNEPVVCIRT